MPFDLPPLLLDDVCAHDYLGPREGSRRYCIRPIFIWLESQGITGSTHINDEIGVVVGQDGHRDHPRHRVVAGLLHGGKGAWVKNKTITGTLLQGNVACGDGQGHDRLLAVILGKVWLRR
jgi:hypothetical protein